MSERKQSQLTDVSSNGALDTNGYVVGKSEFSKDPDVCYYMHNGYEMIRGGKNSDYLTVHRLIAVAEYGFDAVCSKEIHHKNGVRWDNRPENLEPLTSSEHTTKEQKNIDLSRRLEMASDEHIQKALRAAGYHDAANEINLSG